jgi:hypothetical protein
VTSFTVKLNSLDAVSSVTVARLSWGYENAVAVFDKVSHTSLHFRDRRLYRGLPSTLNSPRVSDFDKYGFRAIDLPYPS